MPEIAQEARFMGAVTALSMHEMQNILAIIRESAGLMGDILKVNAKVDFKHRPNMERTLEHISNNVLRGKALLEATSRLAHAPDDDVLESCDLAVYSRVVALLSERLARLKGAAVEFIPAKQAMPVQVGALRVLMVGYQAVLWAVGTGTKESIIHLDTEVGKEMHMLNILPPKDVTLDLNALSLLESLLYDGRVQWDGKRLRLYFPIKK